MESSRNCGNVNLMVWFLDFEKVYGAGEGGRTLDINLGKVALYQLSYTRIPFFEDMIQTRDRQSEIIRKKETRTFLTPHLLNREFKTHP